MRPQRFRLGSILFLALVFRIIAAGFLGNTHVPWGLEYEEIADNLQKFGVYAFSYYGATPPVPTSFIPPVYPILLFFAHTIGGQGDGLVKAVQIVFSIFSVFCLYQLARVAGFSEIVSELAAVFLAVYPPLIAYAVDSSTVTIETFFVLLGSWLTLYGYKNRLRGITVLAGLAWGLAALTRPPWLVVVPVIVSWFPVLFRDKIGLWIRLGIGLLFGVALVLLPWTIRNYWVHRALVPISTNGGLNLWIGNNPKATGEYIFPSELDRDLYNQSAQMSEIQRDHFYFQKAIEYIHDNPVQTLGLDSKKLLYFWFFRPNLGSNYLTTNVPLELAKWAFILTWMIMVPFAVIGFIQFKSGWAWNGLLLGIMISQSIIYAIYFVGTRYRTPTDGFALIWAGAGILYLVKKWNWVKMGAVLEEENQ